MQLQTFTATASALGRACRGSTRLLQSDALELRKKFRTETAALPHGVGPGERQEIATGVPLWPQLFLRPPTRNARQAAGECCHTTPVHPANPHSPLESKRQAASRFLEQIRPNLLPRDDIRRVLLLASNSVIQLRPLRIRQRHCVRFQAFPYRIQQLRLLRSGQAIDLASQIAHILITLAWFRRSDKRGRILLQAVRELCPNNGFCNDSSL